MKLFNEGKLRIEKDLNIIKLVRNIKRLKILMKSSLLTQDVKFQIAHSVKNCIDIDEHDNCQDSNICYSDQPEEN